jgi:plastocyanin
MMLALAGLLTFSACGSRRNKQAKGDGPEEGPKKPVYASKGDEGTITGKVVFEGTPPTPQTIDMSGDAKCVSAAADKKSDVVQIAGGRLANVFVYLKGGVADKNSFPVPSEPVVLDQEGCRYHPRVMGIQVNQKFQVKNSDPTTHNVHPSPKVNNEWNKSQPPGDPPIEETFKRKEVIVPVKCNQHPWMKANVGVLDHPFYAVSAADGTFTIKNVPPGSYTVVFLHETLGEQTAQVTIAAKESKTQDITYKAGTAYAPSSLPVMPALVLPSAR